MTEQALPAWDNEPLSAFFSDAERNERVTSLKMPDVYGLLQRVHRTFLQVQQITEKDNNPNLRPTRFLMARAHSAWLAAVRLALSAQTVEAYPLLRTVIENAWYALHLGKDPAPPARAEVWLRRGESEDAKKRCKAEFTVANVSATHRALDAATEAVVHKLYEWTIDLGGHPNERGVMTTTIRTDTGFGAVFLTNNPVPIAAALKATTEVAVGALKTFQLVYPERFAIMGVDAEVAELVNALNTVFKPYSQSSRR